MIYFIIIIINISVFAGVYYLIKKLNSYIESLEVTVKEQITLVENLKQSLKEVVAEDYLQNDGRLKKFAVQREDRKIIYNGRTINETVEL